MARRSSLGEALIAEDPINADYRRQLVMNYKNGGDYRKFTDKDGALEYFRRAVTLRRSYSRRIQPMR